MRYIVQRKQKGKEDSNQKLKLSVILQNRVQKEDLTVNMIFEHNRKSFSGKYFHKKFLDCSMIET